MPVFESRRVRTQPLTLTGVSCGAWPARIASTLNSLSPIDQDYPDLFVNPGHRSNAPRVFFARHGYVPTEAELVGYFDDVLAAIRHRVVIAVNPTMGYIPRPRVIPEICRRPEQILAVRARAPRR